MEGGEGGREGERRDKERRVEKGGMGGIEKGGMEGAWSGVE